MRVVSEFFLLNRHALWAVVLATVIFGISAYIRLPVQLFPDTEPPMVRVITAYPGASAEDVSRELSRPLEEELMALEGLVALRSSSEDNLSLIELEFRYGQSASFAAVEAQNGINRIKERLPAMAREPQVLSFDTAGGAAITFGMAGEDLQLARRLAEDVVGPVLQGVEGVGAVDIFGGEAEAVVIELDRRRLVAVGLSLDEVVAQIGGQNNAQPAGKLRRVYQESFVRLLARAKSIEELQEMPIVVGPGEILRLEELGEVWRGPLEAEADFAIGGERAVALQVFKTDEANAVEVVRRVEEVARGLEGEILRQSGGGLRLLVGDESASFMESSIRSLSSNILEAIGLAALVIFLFLGRGGASVVASVSMPLSYGLTLIAMGLWGMEFNMVTLSAVILAVGMIVDASVVVIENIIRFREEGWSRLEAAREGIADISGAVLAGAATTMVALVPLLFLDGFVGATFGPLAQTLLMAFSASVVVAILIVPGLSLFIGEDRGERGFSASVTRPFRWVMDRVRDGVVRLLKWALEHRALTLLVAFSTLVVGVIGILSRGMEVLPRMDGGSFYISFETEPGTSLEGTNEVAAQIEAALLAEPEVVRVQRQTGHEMGMRSFSATGAQGVTQGFLTVTLSPRTGRAESIWEIEARIRERIGRIPMVRSSVVKELGATAKATVVAPIVVVLSGEDLVVLDRLGEEVREVLGQVDGVVDPVRTWGLDHPSYQVEVDRLRAASMGVLPAEVASVLRGGSQGIVAGQYFGDRPSAISVVARYQARESEEELLDFPLFFGPDGEVVAVREVARLREERGAALMTRRDLVQTLEITAQLGDRPLSFVMADVEAALSQVAMPQHYEMSLEGERRELEDARGELVPAILMALGAVFLLLMVQLRSFLKPLVIMMSIPLSIGGVSLSLGIAGRPVSMPVMVGLILLVGIAVNNAIILLDVIEGRQREGMARREALVEAVYLRFRPIMMTSVSTIVGMIPLAGAWALGSERFAPLAIAVMGGMTASTMLTLVVVPVLYDVLAGS